MNPGGSWRYRLHSDAQPCGGSVRTWDESDNATSGRCLTLTSHLTAGERAAGPIPAREEGRFIETGLLVVIAGL